MSASQHRTKFELGVSQYAGGLKAFLRQRLGNDEDAEDALQEILYNLLRTAGDDLDSIVNLPAWLYKSARNLLSNLSRRATSDSLDDYDFILGMLADKEYEQESQLLRQIFWDELDNALRELPDEQRLVWELSELEGLSTKEIAAIAGSSQATILSRKHYAVKHLRKKLRHLYNDIITND